MFLSYKKEQVIDEKFIGCSGYYYNHWIKLFYPENLSKKEWLPFYSKIFKTVEINSTFYHMPAPSTVSNWYRITPNDFTFTLKGNRYITHLKKLVVDAELQRILDDFHKKASLLKEKFSCILWQLPASQKADLKKLESFCKLLSNDFYNVFEFREKSWFNQAILDVLKKYNISFCMISSPGNTPGLIATTNRIAYIRFHGSGNWYADNYSDDELKLWKEKLNGIEAKKIFAYFNNDANAYAVNNAITFEKLFDQK